MNWASSDSRCAPLKYNAALEVVVACPYFLPLHKFENGAWLHPSRLPLGGGWRGVCTSGPDSFTPDDGILQECCNMGYAHACPRLPATRSLDAVRFAVSRTGPGKIVLCYSCELAHRPVEHGLLEYDADRRSWPRPHRDARVQAMAQCFVEAHLASPPPESN